LIDKGRYDGHDTNHWSTDGKKDHKIHLRNRNESQTIVQDHVIGGQLSICQFCRQRCQSLTDMTRPVGKEAEVRERTTDGANDLDCVVNFCWETRGGVNKRSVSFASDGISDTLNAIVSFPSSGMLLTTKFPGVRTALYWKAFATNGKRVRNSAEEESFMVSVGDVVMYDEINVNGKKIICSVRWEMILSHSLQQQILDLGDVQHFETSVKP
jgi:hypothetical protein